MNDKLTEAVCLDTLGWIKDALNDPSERKGSLLDYLVHSNISMQMLRNNNSRGYRYLWDNLEVTEDRELLWVLNWKREVLNWDSIAEARKALEL